MNEKRDLRELVPAAIMRTQLNRVIRRKFSRAIGRGDAIAPRQWRLASEEVTRWVLARYPGHLDEAHARRLVREIAQGYAAGAHFRG